MPDTNPCSVAACEIVATKGGMCFEHRRLEILRLRADGLSSKQIAGAVGIAPGFVRAAARLRRPCSVDGCTRTTINGAWCGMHTSRRGRKGDPGAAEPMYAIGSRRCMGSNGYMRIHEPDHPLADRNGWLYEHRAVAYGVWGDVVRGMHVHHVNHDKLDNRPENLELLTPEQHQAEHALDRQRVDPAVVAEMYRRGMSTTGISRELDINTGNVYRMIVAQGVPIRKPKGNR